MTVRDVIGGMIADPRRTLVERWNWKAAIFSATIRALIFLCANLTAGWRAATGAMLAEFVFRALTSGFYGAITQALSQAEPEWAAAMASAVLLPAVSHSIELMVHILRGTPNIRTSLISSVTFTIVSTLFNLYAMRRGALIVGEDGDSVRDDLRRIPRLIAGFVASGPVAVYRLIARRSAVEPAG
jgi:hypothetical protein